MISFSVTQLLLLALLFYVILAVISRILKHRGAPSHMFGAPVERTLGECDLGKGLKVKLYKLGGSMPDRAIGLEFLKDMLPVTRVALSVSEVRKLAALIDGVGSD